MDKNNPLITVMTDGASRGNPGLSGAGVVIKGLDQAVVDLEKKESAADKHLAVFLGTKTNNEAEYLALLLAIKLMLQLKEKIFKTNALTACELVFKMDSLLVVQQMSKEWKIKEKRLANLSQRCWQRLEELGCKVKFEHIDRGLNQEADWLANQAIEFGALPD